MRRFFKYIGNFLVYRCNEILFLVSMAGIGISFANRDWLPLGVWIASAIANLIGIFITLDPDKTPVSKIIDELNEPRPLPLGRKEFEEWTHRLITGAMLPPAADEDVASFYKSQQYALGNMIMHLGPTESHKPDAFFIHSLRKVACNQVAHGMITEIKKERDERTAKEAAAAPKLEVVN